MSNKYYTYELQPTQQKSFYGKAKVHNFGTFEVMQSYDTVMMIKDLKTGNFYKVSNYYSHTTAKHIKAFSGYNTKEFRELKFAKTEINNWTIPFIMLGAEQFQKHVKFEILED